MRAAAAETPDRAARGDDFPLAGRLVDGLHWVLGVGLLIIVAINVVNATGRYVFSYALTGADEIMVFGVIYIVMAGAVLALAQRRHINVNLLPAYTSGRVRHLLYAGHDLAALAACAFATYASFMFLQKIGSLGTTSMTLGIPMTIPHSAVLGGFALMTLVCLVLLAIDLRNAVCDAPTEELELGG